MSHIAFGTANRVSLKNLPRMPGPMLSGRAPDICPRTALRSDLSIISDLEPVQGNVFGKGPTQSGVRVAISSPQ
jgi:hypothetical protein